MARDQTIIIRVSELEQAVLKAKATKYSNGNLSIFLRKAIIKYTPKLSLAEIRANEKERRLLSDYKN